MSSSSISLHCYDRVSTQHDDYPNTFLDIPIQRHEPSTINLDLKIYVRFEKRCWCCGQIINAFNIPQLLSSHYISCDEFFRDGPNFLRRNLLFHDVITSELLDEMIPSVMFSARDSLISLKSDIKKQLSISEDGLALVPLFIGLVIDVPTDVDIEEVAEIILLNYSSQEFKMIPASEEVVRSLDKVVLPEGIDDGTRCCICLENFKERREVSAMACHHFFHHVCVVGWLKNNHSCPLCRYPSMPMTTYVNGKKQ